MFQKKTITLNELEQILNVNTYEAFTTAILQFEEEGILEMVKSKGRTTRTPSLAFQYRIKKNQLMEEVDSILFIDSTQDSPLENKIVHQPEVSN